MRTGLTVVCLLMSLTQATCSSRPKDTISSGVYFASVGVKEVVVDEISQSIKVPLSVFKTDVITPTLPDKTECSGYANACTIMQGMHDDINAIRRETTSYAVEQFERLISFLPLDLSDMNRKFRRSILNLGKFFKSTIGIASNDDVDILKAEFQEEKENMQGLTDSLNGAVEDFALFEEAEDEQMQSLGAETNFNHQAILNMSKDMEIIRHNYKVSRMASSIKSHEEILAARIKHKIDQVCDDVIDLIHGKLSPRLIPIDLIMSGVQDMQKRLQEAGSHLRIRFPSAGNFYREAKTVWMVKDNDLFIIIKHPLVMTDSSEMHFYKLIHSHVPLNHTTKITTHMENAPEYFAISENYQYYAFPKQVNPFEETVIMNSANEFSLIPTNHPHCILSIFLGHGELSSIKKHCDFKLDFEPIEPSIIHLEDNLYLLSNVSTVRMTCPHSNEPYSQLGCSYCLLSVPCGCDVQTSFSYNPPRSNRCQNKETRPTTLHTVNLPLLLLNSEFDTIERNILSKGTIFRHIPKIPHTPLNLFEHEHGESIRGSNKQLSLSELSSENMKKHKYVYRNSAEKILPEIEYNSWTSMTRIIAMVALLSSGVLWVAFLIGCCAYKSRIATIIALSKK